MGFDMTSLQQQARALGDPTRYKMFRYLAEASGPVGVAELTEYLGLNHNAIRQHLAKLVDAALVVEEKAPSRGRGRPRLVYEVDPATESRWGVAGPYERLSLMLSEIVRTGDTPLEVGRRAGRSLRLGEAGVDDPVANLVDQMTRQGFDPSMRQDGSVVDLTMRSCPFETTVLVDPSTVCELHRGMIHGIAEGIEELEIDELVPADPRQGSCRLRCHLELAP